MRVTTLPLAALPLLLASLHGARAHAEETPAPAPPAEATASAAAPDAGAAADPSKASSMQLGIQLGGDTADDDALAILQKMPPDVRNKLDGREIADIVRRAQESSSAPDSGVEILVPLSFFLLIFGVVAAVMFARFRRERQLHETLRQMIERGVEIPPALLMPPQVKPNDRRRGVILLSLGAGASAFLFLVAGSEGGAWGLGLVPAFLGAGYLLASFLEKKDEASAP